MRKTKRSDLQDSASDTDDGDDAAENEALDRQESAEARRKREKWERDHARWLRERDETRRYFFTLFKLWTICPHKACHRAKACRAVDTEECRRDRWREVVPDEVRALIAKTSELCNQGHSLEEALRLAEADIRAHEEAWAEIEARHMRERAANAPARAADEAPVVPEDRAPRIRGL